MVLPLPASGLLEGPRPPGASLFSKLPDVFDFLRSGPSESGERNPDPGGDDALLAQITVRDPSVRAAVLREIERRLSADVPGDAEAVARLERLRGLLRRLHSEGSHVPPGAQPFPAGRVLSVVEKDVPPVAADADLVDRVLRASRLVRARGLSRLRLTLEPPELGGIRLDLTLRGSVVRATFQADAPGAAEILRARLGELKAALEKRGLQVGELCVLAPEAGIPSLPPAPATSGPGRLDLKA